MRVVMYSPDAIGLGHMRRNATIAGEIVKQQTDASVALLIGSGAGAFFAVPQGIDTIKLPSVQKIAADKWIARTLKLTSQETSRVRAGIIRDVILTMKPDILVVDHLPMGVGGDLVPALDLIRNRELPIRVVLGLRDILDDPEIICRRWNQQGHYDFIERYFDDILIYGDQDVFPSAEAYDLAARTTKRIRYVGYVSSAESGGRQNHPENRSINSLDGLSGWKPGERIIVAAGGGGHDAYPMMSHVLAALERMDHEEGFRAVAIAGPLMPDDDRRKLVQQADGLSRTRLLPWTSDCLDYLSAADAAIVMAGYNSSLEALSTKARIVMMPRHGPSAEQKVRARMLAARGLVTCIERDEATTATVEAAIRTALGRGPRQPEAKLLDGAVEAARVLIDLARRSRPAQPPAVATVQSPFVIF